MNVLPKVANVPNKVRCRQNQMQLKKILINAE
jgi:hypothetical protein